MTPLRSCQPMRTRSASASSSGETRSTASCRSIPLTGELLAERDEIEIYPAKHFVTSEEKLKQAIGDIEAELQDQLLFLKNAGKLLEAQRLESRTNYDVEMMRETGYCAGVENYSRHLAQREAGSTPYTLLDYFPEGLPVVRR